MGKNRWQQLREEEEAAARKENHRSGRVVTPDGPGLVVARRKVKNTNGGPGSNKVVVQLDDGRVRKYSPHNVHPEKI